MSRRYRGERERSDELFANVRPTVKRTREAERSEEEVKDIETLCRHAVFKRWIKRTFARHGGMFNNCLKDDAGQAQGVTLYFIARDLSRTASGVSLIGEMVSEHFGSTKKGND